MKLSDTQRAALERYSYPPAERRYRSTTGPARSSTIDALIRKGLVERVPNPDAPGAHYILITPAGRAALEI